MRHQQIITIKVTYDDNACSEECIAGDECCTSGECEDIVCEPVDETNGLLWDIDTFAEHGFEILQASPVREI